ncbi:hypothetical protein KAH55_01075, partial [bacterium]|nr:hypothetical protein [bacterium]
LPLDLKIRFSAALNDTIYQVESPDGLVPADDDFQTIMRYAENNISAAIAGRGTANIVILGFPFETILDAEVRDTLMLHILGFLESRQINF